MSDRDELDAPQRSSLLPQDLHVVQALREAARWGARPGASPDQRELARRARHVLAQLTDGDPDGAVVGDQLDRRALQTNAALARRVVASLAVLAAPQEDQPDLRSVLELLEDLGVELEGRRRQRSRR